MFQACKHTIFAAAALKDLLLVGVLAHEAVNGDLLALPNPVAPCHGLQVVLHRTHTHYRHHSVCCLLACLLARQPQVETGGRGGREGRGSGTLGRDIGNMDWYGDRGKGRVLLRKRDVSEGSHGKRKRSKGKMEAEKQVIVK